jgi:hypothetical protein
MIPARPAAGTVMREHSHRVGAPSKNRKRWSAKGGWLDLKEPLALVHKHRGGNQAHHHVLWDFEPLKVVRG